MAQPVVDHTVTAIPDMPCRLTEATHRAHAVVHAIQHHISGALRIIHYTTINLMTKGIPDSTPDSRLAVLHAVT